MKLVINQRFPPILSRLDYAIIPVVDPEGRVKTLKVQPGLEHDAWLRPEWRRDPQSGRVLALVSVDLTTEREQAGCFFLQHAYEQEGFAAGWEQYQSYLAAQHTIKHVDETGRETIRRRQKTLDQGHFPDELLPRRVLDMRGGEAAKAGRWQPTMVARPEPDPPKGKGK